MASDTMKDTASTSTPINIVFSDFTEPGNNLKAIDTRVTTNNMANEATALTV